MIYPSKKNIIDGINGFIMFALLSYFTEKNKGKNDDYLKIRKRSKLENKTRSPFSYDEQNNILNFTLKCIF